MLQKRQQRFVGRLCRDEPAAARMKDSLQRLQVSHLVVDQQDLHELCHVLVLLARA
jgi:hypothetical protein